MNVKNLGIPTYSDEGGEYILLEDLKLALDHDVYDRVVRKAVNARLGDKIPTIWLERQY